jgi:WD40 repeat protein
MTKRRKLSCILILSIAAGLIAPAAAQAPLPAALLLNEAQRGAISDLAADPSGRLLFSAAEDGSVNVYANQGTTLVQHLQVGPYPLIRVCAAGDQLAAVERLSGGRFRLSVWNYRTATQRYVCTLTDSILHMEFSSQGNFLVCTLARWNSVLFLDLANGNFRPWLENGFGMVDFALMSSREDRLMSYQSNTGTISYHDLASGNLLAAIPTKARLTSFQLVPDSTKTKALAADGQNLALIDLVGGAVIDSKSCGFIPAAVLTDPLAPGRVLVAGGQAGAWRFAEFTIDSGGKLSAGPVDKSSLRFGAGALCLLESGLFAGDAGGRLHRLGTNDARTPLNERLTAPITSAVLSSSGLYLSGGQGSAKVLIGTEQTGAASVLTRLHQSPLPALPPNSNLLALNDRELLFWDGSRFPKLNRLDLAKDAVAKTGASNSGAFLSVRVAGSQVCTVDSSGGIVVWNAVDLKPSARSTAQRAVCATVDKAGRLLVGLGASAVSDTTLQSVSIRNNETIPLANSGNLLFQALADPSGLNFLSLSLASAGKASVTRWETQALGSLVSGAPRQATTILESDGEDIGADLIQSSDGLLWYSSLGGLMVSRWDGVTVTNLEAPNHTPRRLSATGNWLAALNADGSVSLYEATGGRLVADIWLLASGQALLLDRNQHWLLANRLSGSKSAPADPKEKAALLKWLSLPLGAQATSADPAQWEGQLPLSLQ